MKFKDLFEVKKISRIIIIALVIFLLLPVISPEETDVKPIKKENSFTHEDSPLPIFPKENLLEKYVNKLKKFYKMDVPVFTQQEETLTQNETQTIHQIQEKEKSKEDVNITAEDLFFSADYDGEDFSGLDSSPRQEDKTVNLQKGTVLTKDGNLLHPTQEGYYYAEKFYKNGTYPQNKDRRHIEGALNRYHSRVARTLGKKAVYFADDRGNLTVSYVDELPNEIAADIDTYLAQNQIKTPKRNLAVKQNKNTDKYQGATINTQNNNNPDTSDIALASIRDMHAAYNLVKEKIQSGAMGAGIDINSPFQNAIINNFLNNNNGPINVITPENPNEPQLPPVFPEESDAVIAGDQDFAQNYADKIHELNCGTSEESTQNAPVPALPQQNALGNMFVINENTFSCDAAPLIIEQSASIKNNISQETDFDRFKEELNNITGQSDKRDLRIISTDRNFLPVASKLNEEESIRNNNDEAVTVHIIGPKDEESDLAKVLEDITYSITDDLETANQLTDDLSNFYSLTQEENTDTNTMLAFPTENERKVFIITDPNNSYWLKNSGELAHLPTSYMEKNGVYYKGIIVDKTQIGELVNSEKTNLLYVSDTEITHHLPNGSVLTTVTEDDVKINSLHPEQVQKNTDRVRTLTEDGQRALEKAKQKRQQPIEITDLERGNKKIKPKN